MSASTPPGPRPENQRKRAELVKPRRSLIGLLAIVAIVVITFVVLRSSTDHLLGLPPDYLRGSSGFVLAFLIAGSHAVAIALLAMRSRHGRLAATIASFVVISSSVALIVMMLGVPWLPALLFLFGFVELLLVAASTPRKPGRRKHVPGRY